MWYKTRICYWPTLVLFLSVFINLFLLSLQLHAVESARATVVRHCAGQLIPYHREAMLLPDLSAVLIVLIHFLLFSLQLPAVESARASVARHCAGKVITACECDEDDIVFVGVEPKKFAKAMSGRVLKEVCVRSMANVCECVSHAAGPSSNFLCSNSMVSSCVVWSAGTLTSLDFKFVSYGKSFGLYMSSRCLPKKVDIC